MPSTSTPDNNQSPSTPCLMITELFLPTKGGTAVSFDDDFRRLGDKNVHIVTAEVPGSAEFDAQHPNSIYRLIMKRYPWLKPESALIYVKLFVFSLWIAIVKHIKAVFAGRALPEGAIALAVGRLIGRPVLIYAHGEELTGWGRGNKFKAMCYVLSHADWVLSNSDFTKDILVNLIGVKADRVAVIYPTVDAERFIPGIPAKDLQHLLGLANNQKLILSVGRLSRRKGFDNVIRSLPVLIKKGLDVQYALIGTGEDHDYLVELACQLGMQNRVHILRDISYEDLPRWYNTCDVFAMPNRDINGDTEGFGLVFLEAAASGKPALAGLAGGTGSAVVDKKTGLRVDGEKVEEIAAGLFRLLTETEEVQKMGLNARERVLTNFTHQRRVDQIRSLMFKNALDR